MSKRMLLAGGALTAVFFPSLVSAEEAATSAPVSQSVAAIPADEPLTGVEAAICSRLADGKSASFETADRAEVVAFYQGRKCRPLWTEAQRLTHGATRLMDELSRAAEWGLDASDFRLTAVKRPMSNAHWTPDETAAVELELSAAALRYAHEAEGSRIPHPETQLSFFLGRTPTITPAGEVLARLAAGSDPAEVLRSFQPPQDQFLKLKALLADLRANTTDKPTSVAIPARGPMLMPGVRDPDVALLKQRFSIASAPGDEGLFDDELGAAIRRFQASKGLSADGIVGRATRAVLSGDDKGSVSDKIKAVLANMEEWRWMPRSLGATHVLVNVPSFSVTLTNDGKTVFQDRIVVGTPDKQTPIFSKDMTTIVLRPRWNIPDSIKLSMLLSGRSIESQGYVVMRNGRRIDSSTVDWAKAKLSAYTFYQPAGDDNALGVVKLLFPNRYSVYLHDTPSKHLFNDPVRLFSHGCMRVRNVQDFAQDIFNIDRGDAAPDVKRLIRRGPMDNEIALERPIPVHVGYFTVWVDADGSAHYYKDWYGHQKRITLALAGKWDEIDVAREPAVNTAMLKQVRFNNSQDASADAADDDGPMGLTKSSGYRKYDGSVGDMIRQVLGY